MNKPLSKDEILSIAKQNGIKISYLNKLIGGYRGKLTDWKNGKTTLTESELEVLTNYILEKNHRCFSEKENKTPDAIREKEKQYLKGVFPHKSVTLFFNLFIIFYPSKIYERWNDIWMKVLSML